MKSRAERALRKRDPLEVHGTPVFVSWDSGAFESRRRERHGYSYDIGRVPTSEFKDWLTRNSGPMGILWKTVKDDARGGLTIYFAVKGQAMLAKLTWGGS